MKDYCIPANQNFSAELRNNSLIQEKFNQDQLEGVEALINSFFKELEVVKIISSKNLFFRTLSAKRC